MTAHDDKDLEIRDGHPSTGVGSTILNSHRGIQIGCPSGIDLPQDEAPPHLSIYTKNAYCITETLDQSYLLYLLS